MEHEQIHWRFGRLQLPRCSMEQRRKNTFHQRKFKTITGFIRGSDVHLISQAATDPKWTGDCTVYCHRSGDLVILPHNAAMPVSLKVLKFDIFTITCVKNLASGFSFSPLGLVDMFNAGGAIRGLKYEVKDAIKFLEHESRYEGDGSIQGRQQVENRRFDAVAIVHMEVKGCGRFGDYSSAKTCKVEGQVVDFGYGYGFWVGQFVLD